MGFSEVPEYILLEPFSHAEAEEVQTSCDDVIVYSVNKHLLRYDISRFTHIQMCLCGGRVDLLALLFFIITIALRNMRISSSLCKT